MAQSKRTAASYLAEQRNTAVNPFEGLTKQKMKDLYDKKIRGSGKSTKELKKIANQMQAALKRAAKTSTTRQQKTSTTPTKPSRTSTSTPTKPKTQKPKASNNAANQLSKLEMDKHPGLAKNKKQTPKTTKAGDTKTVKGQKYYYDGNKWVKGTSIPTRFKR